MRTVRARRVGGAPLVLVDVVEGLARVERVSIFRGAMRGGLANVLAKIAGFVCELAHDYYEAVRKAIPDLCKGSGADARELEAYILKALESSALDAVVDGRYEWRDGDLRKGRGARGTRGEDGAGAQP